MRTVLLVLAVSLLWGLWPLVTRSAGQHGLASSCILAIAALMPIAICTIATGPQFPPFIPSVIIACAGVMMGTGLLLFNFLMGNPKIEASIIIPIVDVLMLITTAVGGIWFYNESSTTQKKVAIVVLVIGIILLQTSKPAELDSNQGGSNAEETTDQNH